MKRVGKKILELAVAIFVVGALLLGLLYVNSLIENHRDATTTIEDAVVISKERVKGGRRTLTTFYLNIQEKGKSEETKVKVDMGTFTVCKEGSIYNDYPGSRGKCEVEILEVPDYEPFVLTHRRLLTRLLNRFLLLKFAGPPKRDIVYLINREGYYRHEGL